MHFHTIASFVRAPIRTSLLITLGGALLLSGGPAGCASSGSNVETVVAKPSSVTPTRPVSTWPIKTREHVDLWLHGFGLLDSSNTTVPLFQRGYRDAMTVYKNQANVITQFDANIDRLTEYAVSNPRMLDAQFIALYFPSIEVMRGAIDKFVAAGGRPQASSESEAMAFTILANYFRNQRDISWLSLFASSLWDEYDKYYRSYWVQQNRARGNVIDSVQGMWDNLMRPRIQRFLNNTKQSSGDILLSLPLSGEGRTIAAEGGNRAIITVGFPERPMDAPQALYVIAHEVVAPVVHAVVSDNVTPAQERAGYAAQLQATGVVIAGYFLMEQLVPELADGYARYYVTMAGQTPGNDPRAQLFGIFKIPEGMGTAMSEQIKTVQGGI